jgi:hypothetical protein
MLLTPSRGRSAAPCRTGGRHFTEQVRPQRPFRVSARRLLALLPSLVSRPSAPAAGRAQATNDAPPEPVGVRHDPPRITWGVCPTCGSRAAVLWVAVAVRDGESLSQRPVELICLGRYDHVLSEKLAALQE